MKIKQKFLPDELYFSSDTHWFHKNIIEYCNRPFKDIKEMNEKLIENWNSVVTNNHTVFHLGDFAFTSNIEKIKSIVDQLNGKIYLCLGNHDYNSNYDRQSIINLFEKVSDIMSIQVIDEEFNDHRMKIHMGHFPFLFWDRGALHLHGHVHSGKLSSAGEKVPLHTMRYDVGVDAWDYKPVSYNQIKVILTKRELNM